MAKPNRGKTLTVKERAIYVYLPSLEMALEWKKLAEKSDSTISKFVVEHVENSLRQEKGKYDGAPATRIELIKQLQEKDSSIKRLSEENGHLKILLEKLEEDLRRYRVQPFVERNFEGVREYDRKLIDVFKSKKIIDKDELWEALGVDPRQTEITKGIGAMLRNLVSLGVVEEGSRTWRWAAAPTAIGAMT